MKRIPATSRLLIQEHPLQVLPSLATAIGLNEAIFVQQVHYWLLGSTHEHEGRYWIYNTIDEWHNQFPFWGTRTIRRVIDTLRASGVLLVANHNENPAIRTLWYSIDYAILDDQIPFAEIGKSCGQSGHMHVDNLATSCGQSGHMLIGTETTTETTTRDDIGVTAKRAPTIVGKLMQLGVTRGQAINAIKVNPYLSLGDVEHLSEWLKDQPKKYAIGTLVGFLQEGVMPPMPSTNSKPLDWRPRNPDGSVNYERMNEMIAKNPALMQQAF